jgi:hypothetical protein
MCELLNFKMKSYLFKYCLLLFLLCGLKSASNAQDSDKKEGCQAITVYYKTKLNGIESAALSKRLERELKHIQSISSIKTDAANNQVSFQVNSCINLTENQLRKVILDAGAIPMDIKYSKDSTEVFPKPAAGKAN